VEKISTKDYDQKTKESLIWNTMLPVAFQVFRFAIAIVTARILDPKDFGIMGMASIIIYYANSISNFGFSNAIVQRKTIDSRHINSIFVINLVISIFLTLLILLTAESLAEFFQVEELLYVFYAFSSIFLITAFYTVPVTLLRRELDYKEVSKIEFLRGAVQSVSALIFAMLGWQYFALVSGLILSNLVATIWIQSKVTWRPSLNFDKQAVSEIFNFSVWNFAVTQIRLLNDYVDKLIIGKFLGPILLGYYEKAFSISFMPVDILGNRISGVMFSSFARQQEDRQKLVAYLEKSLVLLSTLCFPIFIGIFTVTPIFVTTLLGEKWEPMIVPLKILLMAMLVGSLANQVSVMNISTGNYKSQIRRRAICLVLFTTACLSLVHYGINTIAAVYLGYQVLFLVLSFQLTKKELSVSWLIMLRNIWPALGGTLVMAAAITTLKVFIFPRTSFLNLVILTFTGVCLYSASQFVFRCHQNEFLLDEVLAMVNKFRKRIRMALS